MKIYLAAAVLVFCSLLNAAPTGARPAQAGSVPDASAREYAFTMWDWTAPGRDLDTFRIWAADVKRIGCTRIEISAPWNLLEPRPGVHDLSFIADRLAIAKALGMGLRVRINSYYAGVTPAWLRCDRWRDIDGQEPFAIPSINDERFWANYGPLCTAIARRFQGEDVLFNPFIGVHAELKWSEWWSYDESSLRLWRQSIRLPRPAWLRRVVGSSALPERPPVPAATHGIPDMSPASRAWIAFREECWRMAVRRFEAALHIGDKKARASVPLGESYRRGSATMSNLDYFGLSRGAAQVVHSYDFFWHAGHEAWNAAAAVSSFRGITGLPVCVEFDGPNLQEKLGYKDSDILNITDAVLGAGGGLQVANYSYTEKLPSTWPLLAEMGRRAAAAPQPVTLPARQTTLLFVSKWANYCYREPTEWLHDAQFGAWRMLTAQKRAVRFICEDNLNEDLHGYRDIYVAFSPLELMPAEDRTRLQRLCNALPSIIEMPAIAPLAGAAPLAIASGPGGSFSVSAPGLPVTPCVLKISGSGWKVAGQWNNQPLMAARGRQVVLGFPLAYLWLRGADQAAMTRVLEWALNEKHRDKK